MAAGPFAPTAGPPPPAAVAAEEVPLEVPRSQRWPYFVAAAAVLVILGGAAAYFFVLRPSMRSPVVPTPVAAPAPVVEPADKAGTDAGVAVAPAPAPAGDAAARAAEKPAGDAAALAAEKPAEGTAAAAPAEGPAPGRPEAAVPRPPDEDTTATAKPADTSAGKPTPPPRKSKRQLRAEQVKHAKELIDQGKYAEAREVLTRALPLGDEGQIRELMGLSHQRAGELWPAIHHLDKAAQLSSGGEQARRYVNVGMLYTKLGKKSEACLAFAAADAAAPGHAAAQKQLAAYCHRGGKPAPGGPAPPPAKGPSAPAKVPAGKLR
jgi:hypothetical protein